MADDRNPPPIPYAWWPAKVAGGTPKPLYDRADVLQWARRLLELNGRAVHYPHCAGPSYRQCNCGAAKHNRDLDELLGAFDAEVQDWLDARLPL